MKLDIQLLYFSQLIFLRLSYEALLTFIFLYTQIKVVVVTDSRSILYGANDKKMNPKPYMLLELHFSWSLELLERLP